MDQNHSPKTCRKITEWNRRNQLKDLVSQLDSLVPHEGSREETTVIDQLEDATEYIKSLQMRLERLKEEKERIRSNGERRLLHIEINKVGSTIQIIMVTRSDRRILFSDIIQLVLDMDFEILMTNFTEIEDVVFYTIHSQVGDSETEPEEITRICEMVKETLYNAFSF